jgi:hypothetical protein
MTDADAHAGDSMSVVEPALRVIRRAARGVVNLLPDAPSDDAPRPDIDGRRPEGVDPEALRRLERTRKDGRGGDR